MVDSVSPQSTTLQRIQQLAAERLQANRSVAQTVLDKPQDKQSTAQQQPIKLKGTPVPSATLASAPRGSFVDMLV